MGLFSPTASRTAARITSKSRLHEQSDPARPAKAESGVPKWRRTIVNMWTSEECGAVSGVRKTSFIGTGCDAKKWRANHSSSEAS
jgi:hypothetical protein